MQKTHGSYAYPLDEYVEVNFDHVRFIELVPPFAEPAPEQPESAWRVKVTFADGKSDLYVVAPGSMRDSDVFTEMARLRHKIGGVTGLSAAVVPPAVAGPEN